MPPLVSDFTADLIVWIPLGLAVLVFLASILREHRKDKRDDSG